MTDIIKKVISPKEALESTLYWLGQQPGGAYYAGLLAEMNIRFDSRMPTAGLAYDLKKQEFSIILGRDFFCQLPLDQRIGVLSHEILHFTRGHTFRSKATEMGSQEQKIENIAMDIAINQYIKNLPEGCVDIKQFKTDKGEDFPTFKPWEEYYNLIKQNKSTQEQIEKFMNGQGKDKHNIVINEDGSPSGEGEFDVSKLSEEERKEMLKEAAKLFKRTQEKMVSGYDKIPQEVKDMLERIETEVKGLNYKKILKDTIKKTIAVADRENSWTRQNKRYGNYAPGSRCGRLPVVHFFIDTSGSISVRELNAFLAVVDEFLKVGSKKCEISFWHTSLYGTQKYRIGQRFDQSELQSGGTEVTPTLEYIKKHNIDLSIILTDGYFERSDVKVKGDVIWIISETGGMSHPNTHVGKTLPMGQIVQKG